MRILVDNGTYALENMGDVCMLQVCVARLRSLWPGAAIGVLTRQPGRLARYCPGAEPVDALGRDQFITPGSVLGKLHRFAPRLEPALRRAAPDLSGKVAGARLRRRKLPTADVAGFAGVMRSTDLVVTSGGGYVNDAFPWLAERVLRTLLLAQDMGKRTAMLGQGLGPIDDPQLRELAAVALARLDLLTLRESRANLRLLEGLGVPAARAVVTGDDAVEAAHPKAQAALGTGIGVNVRTTRYSGAGDDTVAALRPLLRDAAAKYGAPLVPVPISFNDGGEDVRVLRSLLEDGAIPADESVQAPEQTMAAAAGCRVVVTGAYHAAVFALSAGVPAIGLAASPYYVDKFEGLRAQFDGGCEVVRLDRPGWLDELRGRIDAAWHGAESLRPALLAAAERQAELGRGAYARMREWFAH